MSTCYGCGTPSMDTNSAGLCTDCANSKMVADTLTKDDSIRLMQAEIERLKKRIRDLETERRHLRVALSARTRGNR